MIRTLNRIKNSWLLPVSLVVIVVLLIVLEIQWWPKQEFVRPIEDGPVPADAVWLGSYSQESAGFTLDSYQFNVGSQRWIYLFSNQSSDQSPQIYWQEKNETGLLIDSAMPLGELPRQGLRIILDESKLSPAGELIIRFKDQQSPVLKVPLGR